MITTLIHPASSDAKTRALYLQLDAVLTEIRQKELPETATASINIQIDELNDAGDTVNRSFAKKKQTAILNILEKQLKIVPKNYYRNLWLILGMSAFGLPIGVALGMALGNMGLLGTGFPFGMCIGILLGASMDKKAFRDGRQLAVEIKH